MGKHQEGSPPPMSPYYRGLARRIALAIVLVALAPYILTFAIFYTSYDDSIRSQVLQSLSGVVESHQRSIDDFLGERLANLRKVAALVPLTDLSRPQDVVRVLTTLRQAHGVFVDLGLIGPSGRHVAYAGPYDLAQADYADSPWFKEVLSRGHYVSDIFLGVRQVPHFVAAVKLSQGGQEYVLRATIDSERFSSLVEGVRLGSTGEAFIVNRAGLYQTGAGQGGRLLTPSGLTLPERFQGVRVSTEADGRGQDMVQAATWLKDGDWLLICRQEAADAFASLYSARRLALAVSLVGLLLLVFITAVLTRYLVGRTAAIDHEKELLNEQIIQSGKLASLGELAAGVAHEINNPLAIMVEEAGWMEDLMADEADLFNASANAEEYRRSLAQIQSQGRRCKEITTKLLGFARRSDAPLRPTQVNDIAAEVVGIVERPARYANVDLRLDLDPGLPEVTASPSELQQVLLNLVNNALDVLEKSGGQVDIRTRFHPPDRVEILVSDNGPGIPPDLMPRLFDPFFTTKPVGKGTGLGLSICYGIVNKLGGSIEVDTSPGQGASFLVRLPVIPADPPAA